MICPFITRLATLPQTAESNSFSSTQKAHPIRITKNTDKSKFPRYLFLLLVTSLSSFAKGKPVVMLGRKASGPARMRDSGVAERNGSISGHPFFLVLAPFRANARKEMLTCIH